MGSALNWSAAAGGSEWTAHAFSPQTNLMYVCGINQPGAFFAHTGQIAPGTRQFGSVKISPAGETFSGTFTAIDVSKNMKVWQKTLPQTCVGGSVATAGGLVFTGGDNSGIFRAYDAKTGNQLWQFQTSAGVNAPPVTYSVGGTQYVAVAVGGNLLQSTPRGDTLWIFSLNGTLGPTAAPGAQSTTASTNGGTSGTEGPGSSGALPSAVSTNRVNIKAFAFDPPVIRIPPGTTVRWSNGDGTIHTATAEDHQDLMWDSGLLGPENPGSYDLTLTRTGVFRYYCMVHSFMKGSVIVDSSAPTVAAVSTTTAETPALDLTALPIEGSPLDAPMLTVALGAALGPDLKSGTGRLPTVTIDPTGDLTVQVILRETATDDDVALDTNAALGDMLTVLRGVYESSDAPPIRTMTALASVPTGPRRLTPMLRAVLSADRAAQIDWQQVTAQEVPSIADEWWVHPDVVPLFPGYAPTDTSAR